MTLEQPAVTWDKALTVLTALANVASIREVNVIGSIARNRQGNDLDVVVVVDIYTYISFLKEMWRGQDDYYGLDVDEKSDYYQGYREQRVNAAFAVIEMAPAEYGWVGFAIAQLGADVDIHVMPEGWTMKIDALQAHLPHKDPQFVANIAGDARVLRTATDTKGLRTALGMGGMVSKPAL